MKQTEEKRNNKIYAIITAVVVVLALFVIFKPGHITKNTETAKAPEVQVIEAKEESTIARIDIQTKLVDADKPQFEVYVDKNIPLKQVSWMPEFGKQGYEYIINNENNETSFTIKALYDTDIKIILRGPNQRNESGERVPVWVRYTSLIVNDDEVLSEPVAVWHNQPFVHEISAKAGNEIIIKASWTKYDAE